MDQKHRIDLKCLESSSDMSEAAEHGVVIAGAGGKGGGGSSSPKEEKDNLESTQIASVIDLISEGEIDGIVGGFKGVYLNNVPVQNENGSYNYPDVEAETRLGWQDQEPISFADTVDQIFPVNQKVEKNLGPLTREITDTNVNAVRFTVTVPRLEEIDEDDGDIEGTKVEFRFLVQYANGSGFVELADKKIKGRTLDPYAKSYVFSLQSDPAGFPVQIRIQRLTDDSNTARLSNELIWTSYTEIIYETLTYPNSALVGLRFSAEQFSSIPSRAYRVRGIKVAIPVNATVNQTDGRLTYSGVWDGTFQQAQWCADPAWILWDLLTSTRYGCGDHIPYTSLDRWSFFSASQYSNALVPDGYGGQEPRFLCNVNIQKLSEAYKLINDLSSVFRAMPFWSAGSVVIEQDRPQDPSYLFTLSNVTADGFNYQNSSQKTKANVALVRYFDMSQRDVGYEIAEDPVAIDKYGVIKRQVEGFGCTSRGQAKRVGKWLIYTEANESEVITFRTSLDAGVVVRPGQTIEVSDPVKAGLRRGGRVVSATSSSIQVDDQTETSLTASDNAKLGVVLPDGTLQTLDISSVSGDTINVSGVFTQTPNVNTVWAIQTDTVKTTLWRVVGVTEVDEIEYEISAVAYNPNKFDAVEQDLLLEDEYTPSLINDPPLAPTNLTAVEVPYNDGNGVLQSRILASWTGSERTISYLVRWRKENGNWNERMTSSTDMDIYGLSPGIYNFEVFSQGANQAFSGTSAKLTKSFQGVLLAVESVLNLVVSGSSQGQALLQWDEPTGSNVVNNGLVKIRYTSDTASPEWASSSPIAEVSSSFTEVTVLALTGVYLARFESSAGILSETSATAFYTVPSGTVSVGISSNRQDPGFSGTKTDTEVSIPQGGLVLTDPAVEAAGSYAFSSAVDLGAVFSPTLTSYLRTAAFYESLLIDDQVELIDSWGLIDLGEPDATSVKVLARATDDDPASVSPTWSAWTPIQSTVITGRGFEFRADLSTTNQVENVAVTELGVNVSLQQRTEIQGVIGGISGSIAVTFVDAFYSTPLVQATPDAALPSGVTYSISSITATGFEITLTGSVITDQAFTYTATGFGREE